MVRRQRYYNPRLDPDSVLKKDVLGKHVAEEIAGAYVPLSKPVQQLLVESFSRAVQTEAGYQYGHLPTEITPDIDRRLSTAQRMVIGRRVGSEISDVVRSMARMAGFNAKEIEAFARGNRPKNSSMYWIESKVANAGLRFLDFKTLVGLSAPGKTYKDLQDALYGSYVRSLAHFAEARKHGDFWETFQSASQGLIQNIGRFNPAQASASGHAGYWLLDQAFYQTRANERASARSFTLSNYETTHPVKAAIGILKDYEAIYGQPASQILKKFGLASGDQ